MNKSNTIKHQVEMSEVEADQLLAVFKTGIKKINVANTRKVAKKLGFHELVNWMSNNEEKWDDVLFWGIKTPESGSIKHI